MFNKYGAYYFYMFYLTDLILLFSCLTILGKRLLFKAIKYGERENYAWRLLK